MSDGIGRAEKEMTESEYKKALLSNRKKNHFCTKCGKQDAYTLSGRARCYECAEKERACSKIRYSCDNKRTRILAKAKENREKRRDSGLCTRCGKRPSEPGKSYCSVCHAEQRNHAKAKRNSVRGENGTCWMCNKNDAIPEKRVCKDCYEKILVVQKKAVETIASKKQNGWVHPWTLDDKITFKGDCQ